METVINHYYEEQLKEPTRLWALQKQFQPSIKHAQILLQLYKFSTQVF